ncbi:tail fiber domain-containing protein, partial [Klebsiella pneumoniae]|uniref:tail fiber domain-containing protein n=1 Tax=Klebsiella pneumoniae TaxID=573 RepID=UPI0034D59F00
ESGSAADVLVDLASTEDGKGDALIGVKQPYVGAVGRTQHDKNTDFINIRDYGIVGDGTDESAKWEKLISNFKGKKSVFAPSGIYTINSVIEAEGLTIYADRISFNGSGYLKQAVIVGTSSDGVPFIDMGSTLERQDIRWGKLFKIGSSDSGLSGLQIGGAGGAKFGSEGMVHHMDGYDGWAVETTSRWPSSTEHALMPSSRAGRCRFTAGNSSINIEIGADLLPQDIGQVVWIKDSAYVVTGVGDRNFTVTNPPNYSGVETYTCTYNWGKGKCTVTGKKITCTYGDPFNFVIPTRIVVNGIVNYIDSFIDTRNVVLRNDMGNLTDVDYFWSGTVDDLAAAFRLHRISGAGYEENISLIAYNKGYYHLHAGSGGPSQFPIFIGSGWDANGAARKSITVSGDGLVSIGGKYGTCALEVGYRQEIDGDSNRLRIDSAKGGSGGWPTISALGTDANIGINIKPKGTGVVKIDGVQEVNGANLPSIDNRYTSGSPSNRWNMVFSANGVQQTSDASLKTKIKPFTKEEVSAAIELSTGAGTYQWLKDCRDFGEQSGVHIGYTVQHVIEVLTKNGLNWENYKMIQKDDDSNVYSINYSELIIFVMAGIVARLTK